MPTLFGGSGPDNVVAKPLDQPAIIFDAAGNDTLTEGTAADTLLGEGGADTPNGAAGNDVLVGAFGDDTFNTGLGDDVVFGGSGNDNIGGMAGRDVVDAGPGNDFIAWNVPTGDVVFSGDGADTILGGGSVLFIGRLVAEFEAGDFVIL